MTSQTDVSPVAVEGGAQVARRDERVGRLRSYPAETCSDVQRPTFTSFLDFARWTAAAMVFVGHLRNPMFLGYGDVLAADQTVLVKLWYFLSGWHAEAVVVFFVLSGYLVGGLAAGKLHAGQFSFRNYAIDRATRIYVAFLPALLLTALLDTIGANWLGAAGLYDHTQPMVAQKIAGGAATAHLTLEIFGMNAASLQHFLAPTFGSNHPLWTISAEFWFYFAFGFVVLAILPGKRGPTRLAALAASASIFLVLGLEFVGLMGLWLIGVAAGFTPRGRHEQPLAALTVFLAALVAARVLQDVFDADSRLRLLKNFAVALAFCWLLVSMRQATFGPLDAIAGLNRRMADFSFSLYLIHFPVTLFLLSALYATGLFPGVATGYAPTDPVGLALYACVIALGYGCAWSFAQLTEQQTWRARRYLRGVFGRPN